MESALTAIIENAERLLRDARVLADTGSYRTAISLAVLSLEESGKACLIRWKMSGYIKRDIRREIRNGHIDKHHIFGAYRVTKAIFSVGIVIRREHLTPELENAVKDHPGIRGRLAKALQEHAELEQKIAESGLFDYFKQDGFYVDLDHEMKAVAPSIPYNSDWFEMISQYAREAIDDMARAEPSMHEIMAIIYDMDFPTRMSVEERRKTIKRILENLNRLGVTKG